ncbi:hypothetical protein A2U01_0038312, partial [Trifolium medium]|nr:hypothetical protein [Trifolium medium]
TTWDVGTYSINEAEALALLEAIQAAINMHMEYIIFESDSQNVANAQSRGNLSLHSNFEVKFVKR